MTPQTCNPSDVNYGSPIPKNAQTTIEERRPLSELKNRHAGDDIWVIGAGASLNFVDPAFFDGKITVGVNWVHRRFRCSYLVLRNVRLAAEACLASSNLILSERFMGRTTSELNRVPGSAWYFPHEHRDHRAPINLSVVGTDKIVVGASIIVSAIHVAAYLGARNIIICGHDCGSLDGKLAFDDYYDDLSDPITKWRMLNRMEPETVELREKLHQIYGCRVYALNPFVNFGMEGHEYRRTP